MKFFKKPAVILTIFFLSAIFGICLSVMKGSVEISVAEIFSAISGNNLSTHEQILNNIRLPRTIVAALVGINLSLSGAILQAVMKNPLADPHIIGISSGAGLAGIAMMLLAPEMTWAITPVSFFGAMSAAMLIYILAWKNGIRPIRIILAGVAVSAFLGAGISSLMILHSDKVHSALMWMVGGLSARSWNHVEIILPYTIFGILLAMIGAKYLNVLALGDETAKSLGLNVEVVRLLFTALAALLAASAVSVVGLLGFVGLIVPHAARLIIGSDHNFLLPATALLGVATVTISDTFARTVFAPVELPVGIVMAVAGAPFFLFLLRKEL